VAFAGLSPVVVYFRLPISAFSPDNPPMEEPLIKDCLPCSQNNYWLVGVWDCLTSGHDVMHGYACSYVWIEEFQFLASPD